MVIYQNYPTRKKSIKEKIRNSIKDMKTTGKVILLSCGFIGTFVLGQYLDLPGWTNAEAGRTKNSISAVVAGIIGKKLYENSKIDVEIQKRLYPDARLTGITTPDSIDTYIDLILTSSNFIAQNNQEGKLEGEVKKSEFDWKLKQVSNNTYEISRFGPKFDSELEIHTYGGIILGKYIRHGPNFDWDINGNYDENGNVRCKISCPLGLDIVLNGKITPN